MPIYFVTSNENKFNEVKSILKIDLERKDIDLDEIQDIGQEKIIKHKARQAFLALKKPVLIEDTGLFIEAWNGFPGALIRWMLKTVGNEGICKMMENEKVRNATAKTYFCLYKGKEYNVFVGEIKGKVPSKPKGKTGFGWDPIFIPQGYKKSFAEMTKEEKNAISMRAIALKKLMQFLTTQRKKE
ncbi:non-canonical purine NTP pyrophosphatase, RdgB/HAM1 family [Candidatus Pacearchaeota archaeon RBG_13_36_9]|nr:MAG: non-canonical purine NTP pyrophosphatase, RdgB/HAM1 family [Candidatus Pacearchaeota archaeon RBG_13_36_9]